MGPRRAIAVVSLGVILATTLLVLLAGILVKKPCASGVWGDGRQYKRVCYSDIIPLFGTEHLTGGRLPYLDACSNSGGQCDEYPVLTMYFMRLAAYASHSYSTFFYVNVYLLAVCAFVVAYLLYRLAASRALYFAAAPTLLVYGFMNWDLMAVALATAGTYAFVRRRDQWSGAVLGLGAAAKLYPGFLVVPFALDRMREGRRGSAASLVVWAGFAFGLVNLPFVVAAPHSWSTFFRFNSVRPVDWDSLWFVACTRLHHVNSCSWSPAVVNVLSLLAFAGLSVLVWVARARRQPYFPRWNFGFPLVALFLLTSKVFSPQYSLWLLPWFALALPDLRLFIAYEAADVAVFLTRFTYFGRLSHDGGDPVFAGYHGSPLGAFQLALVLRAIILVWCLVAWVRGREAREPSPQRSRAGRRVEALPAPEAAA
jgi:uncharacterized membrane protein